MADEADLAQAHLELDEMIRRKYNVKPALEVEATGECLNCYEPIADIGRRWCNVECQYDWGLRRRK
jgi:hypothetical protein